MYGYHFFLNLLEDLPDMIRYRGLPRGCWNCSWLNLCRRGRKEKWKCYHGCMVLNKLREDKRRGIDD